MRSLKKKQIEIRLLHNLLVIINKKRRLFYLLKFARQSKRGGVHLAVVVLELELFDRLVVEHMRGLGKALVGLETADDEADQASRIGRYLTLGVRDTGENVAGESDDTLNQITE